MLDPAFSTEGLRADFVGSAYPAPDSAAPIPFGGGG